MAIELNMRDAQKRLKQLRAQDKRLIGQSVSLHGKWVELQAAPPTAAHVAARKAAWVTWTKCIQQIHALEAQIREYEDYTKHGATTASLDLAKGVAVWEGGKGRDGLFHPYRDVVGVWTIGYGHTNADGPPAVSAGARPLTQSEATTLLLHDLNTFYVPQVRSYLKKYKWIVNQKMFDALVSFAYNLGPGYFGPSHDIGAAMSRRNAVATADAIMLYDKAGHRLIDGLFRRRSWERQLFLGGHYNVT